MKSRTLSTEQRPEDEFKNRSVKSRNQVYGDMALRLPNLTRQIKNQTVTLETKRPYLNHAHGLLMCGLSQFIAEEMEK